MTQTDPAPQSSPKGPSPCQPPPPAGPPEVLLVVSRSALDSNGTGKISLNSPLPPLAILSLISTLIEMLVNELHSKDITFKSQKRIDIVKPGNLMNFLRHKK